MVFPVGFTEGSYVCLFRDLESQIRIYAGIRVFAIFGFRRFGVNLASIWRRFSIFDLRLFHNTDLASTWRRFFCATLSFI